MPPAGISLRPSKELDSQWKEASEAVSFQKGENMERNRKALGRYAKSKGKRGEREVANMLKAAGFTAARRTAQFCGKSGGCFGCDRIARLPHRSQVCRKAESLECGRSGSKG